jgi:hypothetical protein
LPEEIHRKSTFFLSLLEIAGAFDDAWRTNLESFLADSGRKEAIDSIIANRHLIVHGKDSGITLVRVKEYLQRCIEVIDFLEFQCGVRPP